ncbi:GPI ethanolamine phosphate transferase 1 isoform X2 [Phalaenopsis equestris]|uniref:GPI ethanolamine phosphate transferase 1 isoform X2 n=1 Tax=Phalaenopsis equestris TaxID=78828 RepID=UPI0009E1D104|nr:GPI ethanolamine phosphate transferase 1 isoform X2 [Phalaenopsis equestris]
MAGAGILSGGEQRKRQVWRRERWLVALGIALHAIYMLSIFDIYFKTPIVHGMDPVPQRFPAPAKRLVLLIADGLRADKFFEPESDGRFRAPFLRSVMLEKGRWGVSHARPPTESRPGHVAIIAGFYEDPSAVTKGWKANPVEFDSVFNRSRHTFAFGSPDIIPIFCGGLSHSTWGSYPHEFEDFATDASFLDQWSFDQFYRLLNRSYDDNKLRELLQENNVVIFLHLLGCDTNGHAHRPYSSIYLNNIRVVDQIAEKVYNLVENYFKDNKTSYIFTADHGMSDKGSHGDGHPTNTDTPLVAWGAGIKGPKPLSQNHQPDNNFRFVDDHKHDSPTPYEWGLTGIERVDVNQADIAPLMATLVGLPCPVNSVGNLPLQYLQLNKEDEVEAALSNTKEILNQFLRKSQLKQSSSLQFKPFKPLTNYSSVLGQIEDFISAHDYEPAMKLSENLRRLSLAGIHYFQTYDWFMLMSTVTLGYVGWMINLILHILQSYTLLSRNLFVKKNRTPPQGSIMKKVYVAGSLLMGLISVILLVEKSPMLYHAYAAMTVFLWTRIFSKVNLLKVIWKLLSKRPLKSNLNLLATFALTFFILELLVTSFFERKLYTWCFLFVGVFTAIFMVKFAPQRFLMAAYVLVACCFLSIFTLMPAEIPENTHLVVASGAFIILVALSSILFEAKSEGDNFKQLIAQSDRHKLRFPVLFYAQVLLVGLSSVMVILSTSHRAEKRELLAIHQFVNWLIAGLSMILPLFSKPALLTRLTSIFLGFAPTFLLLSIGYEAVFYSALALVLMGWILVECTLLSLSMGKKSPFIGNLEDKLISQHDTFLILSHIRIPLAFGQGQQVEMNQKLERMCT